MIVNGNIIGVDDLLSLRKLTLSFVYVLPYISTTLEQVLVQGWRVVFDVFLSVFVADIYFPMTTTYCPTTCRSLPLSGPCTLGESP